MSAFLHLDFWMGVGVIAGIYGVFSLGIQLNVGLTGLVNFGQAGFMAIGAYSMAMLVLDAGWSLWAALPASMLIAALAALLVGLSSLRLRADYFAIATIAFAETIRYVFQNADFAGGNQGMLGFDGDWRSFAEWLDAVLHRLGLGLDPQMPLLVTVWLVNLALILALRHLQASPWGRVLVAIREDEDAARALGKNVMSYKLQSLCLAAMLAAVAGFFLAINVSLLYPSEFDPSFTFFGYTIVILGGYASYPGVALGASVFWALLEGTRLFDLPLSAGQYASLRFVVIGVALILLAAFMPQGLLGRRAELGVRR